MTRFTPLIFLPREGLSTLVKQGICTYRNTPREQDAGRPVTRLLAPFPIVKYFAHFVLGSNNAVTSL
ncbi:MAG: hypothetical protein EON54_01175 [Alcaligenaceae bacterium]|nr:MAG: hypothetical protein EON54_01175 [Alcaligenaceae bacterium]